MKELFTGNDLKIMQALVYDSACEPGYEMLKGVLVWSDERPEGLTPDAYKNLCDLWVARSFLYHGRNFADTSLLNPEYYKNQWQCGLSQVPAWPGFKRLALNEKDKAYFTACMSEQLEGSEI
jgi:hypothetical protein